MASSISYWQIGQQYLQLVEIVSLEIVKAGNPCFIPTDLDITSEEYEEATKWSSHNLSLPVHFNFFHGIETILKGFLVKNGTLGHKVHSISALLLEFEKIYPGTSLGNEIKNCTENLDPNSPLGRFLSENGLSSTDGWHEALKYPESKGSKTKSIEIFDHFPLKYSDLESVQFWEYLGEKARKIRIEAVTLAKNKGMF